MATLEEMCMISCSILSGLILSNGGQTNFSHNYARIGKSV